MLPAQSPGATLTMSLQFGSASASGNVGASPATGALNVMGQSGLISSQAKVTVSGQIAQTGQAGSLAASGRVIISSVFAETGANGSLNASVATTVLGQLHNVGIDGTFQANGTVGIVTPSRFATLAVDSRNVVISVDFRIAALSDCELA